MSLFLRHVVKNLEITKKDDKQTYVEFANQTEVYFDRWCSAKKIVSDYEKRRQIILIEQFKRCVHDDLKTFLDEKNVEHLHEMAVLADYYDLMHKRSFKPRQGCYSKPSGGSGGSGSSGSSSVQTPTGVSHGSNAGNKQVMIRIVPVPVVAVVGAKMFRGHRALNVSIVRNLDMLCLIVGVRWQMNRRRHLM